MENQQRKKTLLIGTTVVMVLIFIIGTTLAYLTEAADTLNQLNVGRFKPTQESVQITLVEDEFHKQIDKYMEEYGPTTGFFRSDADTKDIEAGLFGLIPGDTINKDPTIVNIGVEEVYLRMRVLDHNGNNAFENPILSGAIASGDGLGLRPADHWIKRGDFYYYSEGQAQTGTGSALDVRGELAIFDYYDDNFASMKIPLSWNWSHEALAQEFELTVQVQAIQYRYFDPDISLENPWLHLDGAPVEYTLH